jgi:hypothetical protein
MVLLFIDVIGREGRAGEYACIRDPPFRAAFINLQMSQIAKKSKLCGFSFSTASGRFLSLNVIILLSQFTLFKLLFLNCLMVLIVSYSSTLILY